MLQSTAAPLSPGALQAANNSSNASDGEGEEFAEHRHADPAPLVFLRGDGHAPLPNSSSLGSRSTSHSEATEERECVDARVTWASKRSPRGSSCVSCGDATSLSQTKSPAAAAAAAASSSSSAATSQSTSPPPPSSTGTEAQLTQQTGSFSLGSRRISRGATIAAGATADTATSSAGAAAGAAPSSPGARPSGHAKQPSSITSWIRSRVSQNKIRFRDGEYNLDLTYITPHIIAMGYPAHGTEYYIRNPIDEVERFFAERHAGHYRVYNLCSERVYDSARRFQGCFRRFPFDDHNVPRLSLILQFVLEAATFLGADADNVVAIHCKAGKGRTGIMVSCLLFYLYPDRFPAANDAMRFFDQRRTCDGKCLTIPSQRRYVLYFEKLLRDYQGTLPPVQRPLVLRGVTVRVAREHTITHPADLYFTISNHQQVLLDSRVWFPRGPTVSSAGCVFSFASLQADALPAALVGDVKFAFFRRRPIVLSGKKSMAFYLWFNTTLCSSLHMVYHRAELDKVDVAAVGKAVMVSLSFTSVAVTEAKGEEAASSS